jgi:hypothetical protein
MTTNILNRQIGKLFQIQDAKYEPIDLSQRLAIDPFLIRVIEQTPENCLAAVKVDGMTLQFITHQTPEICLAAVDQCGYSLRFVHNQTFEIIKTAVRKNGLASKFMKSNLALIEFRKELIDTNANCIRYLPHATREDYVHALTVKAKHYLDAPASLRNDYGFQIEAVRANAKVIRFIPVQTPELCRIAVAGRLDMWKHVHFKPIDLMERVYDYDSSLITEYTTDGSDEYYVVLCKNEPRYAAFIQEPENMARAIRRNPRSICFIDYHGIELYTLALQQDPSTIQFVPTANQYVESLVKADPALIRYAPYPSLELCRLATRQDPAVLNLIAEPVMENLLFPDYDMPALIDSGIQTDLVSLNEQTDKIEKTEQDIGDLIDNVIAQKIPDADSLQSMSRQIIHSDKSTDEKTALLRKLFQF